MCQVHGAFVILCNLLSRGVPLPKKTARKGLPNE
jgi:hypothetical protein